MKQGLITRSILFKTNKKFAKPVIPRMRYFNDPSPIFERSATFAFFSTNTWRITMSYNCRSSGFPIIPFISIEKWTPLVFRRTDHPRFEDSGELAHIMPICSGHDKRQRDTTPVYEQMSFAAFFSPCQSGLRQPPLCPLGT